MKHRLSPLLFLGIGAAALLLHPSCRKPAPLDETSEALILRIGTAEKVGSANILLDQNLAVLAHLSNPPLMRMAADGRIVGQVAEKAEVSDDAREWTFTLRSDLLWSDGRPVSVEDAAFTLEYLRDHYPPAAWMKTAVRKISVAGPGILRIRLTRPYARLDVDFTTYKLLPRHVWSDVPSPLRYTNPGPNVGCGPFVIERIDIERGLVRFVRNPYWHGPPSRLDEIEVHLYKNRDVLSLALEKGDVDIYHDYADSFPYANLERILSRPDIALMAAPSPGLFFLGFNLKRLPMSDIRFREAVAAALDHEEIVRLFLLGRGRVPTRGFVPDTLPFYKPTPVFSRDLPRAARLLEEAGFRRPGGNGLRRDSEGRPLVFTLLTTSDRVRLAEIVAGQLRDAGLDVRMKSVDGVSWVALKDEYRYDLIIGKTSPWGLTMHAGWATGYFDARRTGEGVLHTVDDPAFLALCDDLLAAPGDDTRADLAHRVQDDYAARLPAVALCWNTVVIPYNQKFAGWVWDPLYGFFNLESFLNLERRDP